MKKKKNKVQKEKNKDTAHRRGSDSGNRVSIDDELRIKMLSSSTAQFTSTEERNHVDLSTIQNHYNKATKLATHMHRMTDEQTYKKRIRYIPRSLFLSEASTTDSHNTQTNLPISHLQAPNYIEIHSKLLTVYKISKYQNIHTLRYISNILPSPFSPSS